MDSRIEFQRPTGPVLPRKLGDRPPKEKRAFTLAEDDESQAVEPEDDSPSEDADVLSPQPRSSELTVSRVRLEDEAGRLIDIRG